MDRKIKFRAWSFEYNRFLDCESSQLWNYFDGYANPVDRNTGYKTIVVQQFTGLLDSDGKEIYEGDSIKYDNHPDVVVVRWTEEGMDYNGWITADLITQSGPCKIVGNTHEKPDPDAVYDFERGAWRLGQIYYKPKRPSFTLKNNTKE